MTQTTDNELDYEEEVDSEEEELVGDKKNLKKQKRFAPREDAKLILEQLQAAIHMDQNLTWKD